MKDVENYKDIIGKELPTLELMNTYYAILKVFVRNKISTPLRNIRIFLDFHI